MHVYWSEIESEKERLKAQEREREREREGNGEWWIVLFLQNLGQAAEVWTLRGMMSTNTHTHGKRFDPLCKRCKLPNADKVCL